MDEWMEALESEWDIAKNAPLTFKEMTRGSGRKVWWRCKNGHEWLARFSNRVRGSECPFCRGKKPSLEWNLAVCFPAVATEWHPTLNGDAAPEMMLPHSNKRVWWRCKEGYEWQASPNNRMAGYSCPFCNQHRVIPGVNSLAMMKPEVAQQWESGMNRKLTPDDISPFSNKKVWWSCEHGHKWKATVASRSYGHDCPICWNHKQKSRRYLP